MPQTPSPDAVKGPPPSIPWYQSSQLRTALLLFAPVVLRIAKHFGWVSWFFSSTEDLVDWTIALLAMGSGIFWAIKRIKAGNDPKNDTSAIQKPAVVTATVNLTNRLTK